MHDRIFKTIAVFDSAVDISFSVNRVRLKLSKVHFGWKLFVKFTSRRVLSFFFLNIGWKLFGRKLFLSWIQYKQKDSNLILTSDFGNTALARRGMPL